MGTRVSSPVFIGRVDELSRLTEALDHAHAGRSSTFVVAGEAGVGKTRLVNEIGLQARERGAVVLYGGCVDLGENGSPYAPLVEALRTWAQHTTDAEIDEIVGRGRPELARLVPDLGPVDETPSAVSGGLSYQSAQGRLFELVLAMLQRLAARTPVVLVVEDLHWSDRSTRDMLAYLTRNARDTPLVLVFTYRSDELHRRHPLLPFLAELERTGRVERIELRRFDRRELVAQLGAIADRELDPQVVDSIHARSEGNPFFAEELLLAADETADETATKAIPSTLREVLLVRIAGLADSTQELLRVASAAGPRIDPALLTAVTTVGDTDLYDGLRDAVTHQVLLAEDSAGVERYTFRHALLQEAIYDDLLPGERTRLHAAFARTLDEARIAGDGSRSSELAFHWYRAHDLPRAFEAALRAARAAHDSYAFPEELANYERALELWDRVAGASSIAGRDRIDVLAEAALAASVGDPTRAMAHIESAIDSVDADVEPIRASRLHERRGRYAWLAGMGELSLASYRTAVRLAPSDPEAQARALAGLAQILMLHRRNGESRALAEDAIGLAQSTGARQIEGHALNTRGLDRALQGEVEEALEDMAHALHIAEEVGNLEDIGRAYANWIDVLALAGRLEEATRVAFDATDVVRQLGVMTFYGAHYLCYAASFLFRLGRWEDAGAAARLAEEAGAHGINEILTREVLARLAMARGDFDLAGPELRGLGTLAVRSADGQVVGPVHATLAELALWQRQPDAAADAMATFLAMSAGTMDVRYAEVYVLGVRVHADRAERARLKRSDDGATEAIAAGRAYIAAFAEWRATYLHSEPLRPVVEAWLAVCKAETSRLDGEHDPAAWTAAAEGLERLELPYMVAYCRWREAEAVLGSAGKRAHAAQALSAAFETASRLGARPLLSEVEALAHRARITLAGVRADEAAPTAERSDGFGLTEREREVLTLIAAGRTNRQIGTELFISVKTAGVHVSNILGKLGVSSRGEAGALAHRLGLDETRGTPGED